MLELNCVLTKWHEAQRCNHCWAQKDQKPAFLPDVHFTSPGSLEARNMDIYESNCSHVYACGSIE